MKYFLAVFGDPKPPGKDTVESGTYHPNPEQAPFPTKPGDVLLLYCTGGYPKHAMEAPGIGIVLAADRETVHYRYLPLSPSIPIDRIRQSLTASDVSKFKNIRFDVFWLFEISRESFVAVMDQHTITWPEG